MHDAQQHASWQELQSFGVYNLQLHFLHPTFYTMVQKYLVLLVVYCSSDKDADSVTSIPASASEKSDSP